MEQLLDVGRTITRNLPPVISDQIVLLLGSQKCYRSIVEDLNYRDVDCLRLVLSKVLGVGIVLGGSIVKLPQILKIVSSGSGRGVSVLGYLLETAAFLITLAYNVRQGFAFSTYGETLFILVQNVVVALLVLYYARRGLAAGLVVGLLSVAVYVLFGVQDSSASAVLSKLPFDVPSALVSLFTFGGHFPKLAAPGQPIVSAQELQYLQTLTIPLSLASKLPQILGIWRARSIGQLSAFAVFNYLLGSLARVFTTFQEVKDPVLLWGFVLGAALNLVLTVQVLYYWNGTASKRAGVTTRAQAHKSGKKDL